MDGFRPSADQRAIASAFSRNAQLLGASGTLSRLESAAGERFDQPRIGQLVAHVAARQAEFVVTAEDRLALVEGLNRQISQRRS